MKGTKSKRKVLALSLALAAAMLPMVGSAQESDKSGGGLFGRGAFFESNEWFFFYDRSEGMGLGEAENQNPTETPLGGGIAILTAIGAGYALLKRKEDKQ